MELTRRRDVDAFEAALAASGGPAAAGAGRELSVVAMLRSAGQATAAGPDEAFRAALRTRLLAVAAVQGVGSPEPVAQAVSWRQRATVLAAGLATGAVAVTGVAAAASMSLPGDPFYGLKRTTEQVRLDLPGSSQARAGRHVDLAAERVHELRELALGRGLDRPSPSLPAAKAGDVAALLDDVDAQARDALGLLRGAPAGTDRDRALTELVTAVTTQAQQLQQLLPGAAPAPADRLRATVGVLADVRAQALALLPAGACADGCGAAPGTAPAAPAAPGTVPATDTPAPTPAPTASAAGPGVTVVPPPSAVPSAGPSAVAPTPTSRATAPAPSATLPVPLPTLPVPLPLPLPLPTTPVALPTVSVSPPSLLVPPVGVPALPLP